MSLSIEIFLNMSQEEIDIFFMNAAIKEAKKAFDRDEVPVGSVIVVNNKIIAKGHNQTEQLKDATAHAEMICITSAEAYYNDWRLEEATLYTTLEPCLMCAGAMLQCRIKRLVWAAEDTRVGANGSWINIFDSHPLHKIEIKKHVLKDVSSNLMKSFFQKKR